MADTISTYQRKKSDAQYLSTVRTASAQSAAAAGQYTRQYVEGLSSVFKGIGDLAKSYYEVIERREVRDANTDAEAFFRKRRAYLQQNVKGKQADGMLDIETAFSQKAFELWAKDRNISTPAAKEIWRKQMEHHLNRVGAYMLEQQAAYDKSSRRRAADSGIDGLAETQLGDLKALSAVYVRNEQLFANDPDAAERYNDKATMTAFSTWAARDPAGTLAWFDKHADKLAKIFGSKFPKVHEKMNSIRKMLVREEAADAARAAAEASRAAAAENRAARQEMNRGLAAIVLGQQGTAQAISTQLAQSGRGAEAMRIVKSMQSWNRADAAEDARRAKAAARAEGTATKEIQDSNFIQMEAEALFGGGLSPELIVRAVQEGAIRPPHGEKLLKATARGQKIPEDVKAAARVAKSVAHNVFPTKDMTGMPDSRAIQAQAVLNRQIQAWSNDPNALKLLDPNDPNSALSRTVRSLRKQAGLGSLIGSEDEDTGFAQSFSLPGASQLPNKFGQKKE